MLTTDTSVLYIAMRNANRSISDVLSFESDLIVDPHTVFRAFSDLTGPLSSAKVTVYICWNPVMAIKFLGNPECRESPSAGLQIVTPKAQKLYVHYTDIPPVLHIKS
jgi:hypothetical protein